jgi:hypothetical protein
VTKKKRHFISLKQNVIKHFFNIDEIPEKKLGCLFTHITRLGYKGLQDANMLAYLSRA